MGSSLQAEVDRFLSSPEANFGLASLRGQQLVSVFEIAQSVIDGIFSTNA
jgi:hypothetical protein